MQIKNPILKSKIIEIARECFFEKGYKDTSLIWIAQMAHTSVGNLYNYFQNKEDIFEAVIDDVPLQIDQFIAKHYKDIVKQINFNDEKINLDKILPSTLMLTPDVSMVFSILLKGSEGTIYEYYKESLLKILKDYTMMYLGEKAKANKIEAISYAFIQKILSLPQDINIFTYKRTWDDLYDIKIDENKKIVFVEAKKWLMDSEWEFYWAKYKTFTKDLNLSEYQLVLDSKGIANVAEDKSMLTAIKMYYADGFNSVTLIFSKKQIAFMFQAKRLFNEGGFEKIEVIIQ